MAIYPSASQLEEVAGSFQEGPVVMLNLLRFKDHADGVDEGVSGAQAYARYSAATEPFLRAVGGSLRVALWAEQSVVGPEEPEWDLVLLVEYPSRAKFLEMAANPEYQKVHAHRDAALADSRLIACSEVAASVLAGLS